LSLDALSSVAYGPEAIVLALVADHRVHRRNRGDHRRRTGPRSPGQTIGQDLGPIHATEALGIVVLLKAFAAGCSALTGVEAIANGVPQFRAVSVKRAQHTEVAPGVLLGSMLIGLSLLIRLHNVVPRGNVTVLAQLSAAAFGTGWAARATLNGFGAVLTAAAIIFMASKFTEGPWQLLIIIPALMLLFARIEHYYRLAGEQLGLGRIPPRPTPTPTDHAIVVIPVVAVNKLTERGYSVWLRDRELDRGDQAASGCVVERDRSVHCFDESARDCQPESDALSVCGRVIVAALESREDGFPIGRRDSRTVIDDADLDRVPMGARCDADQLTRGRVAQRIFDQVGDGPFQQTRVSGNGRQSSWNVQLHLGVLRGAVEGVADHVLDCDRRCLHGQYPDLQPG
jgi:hypothetical protein